MKGTSLESSEIVAIDGAVSWVHKAVFPTGGKARNNWHRTQINICLGGREQFVW